MNIEEGSQQQTVPSQSTIISPPPKEKKKKNGCLIAVLVVLGFMFLFVLSSVWASAFFLGEETMPFATKRDAVALIRIDGPISSDYLSGTGTSPEEVIDQIRKAEEDPSIKSILIRINSPGGTASASDEIAREIKRAKKPVVASIADVGASGGYWVASACDKIVCNPASSVGSIGVIIAISNLEGLFEKIGVKYIVLTKGRYKDLGNPAREMTEEEKQILQRQLDAVYEQFINTVSNNRKMKRKKVEELATGEIFVGEEALKLGLVDKLGNYRDAKLLAGKMGNIEGEPEVRNMREIPIPFGRLLELFLSEAKLMKNLNYFLTAPIVK